jgi:hypothetical protein
MRDWDVFLSFSSAKALDDDAADALVDTVAGAAGVISYRGYQLSAHAITAAADPADALRQVRELLATAGIPLTLESVQIGPAAPLDGELAAAS